MYLETRRLVLRSWTEDDVEPYARIVADPEVMRFIGDGATHTCEQARRFIRTMMTDEQERGWIRWAVAHKQTSELMGFCGFGVIEEQLDFGWRYAQKFWGQGFGTEAARAALHYGVATYGWQEIQAVAYTANPASLRIMEKIGMRWDRFGTLHNQEVAYYSWRAGQR